jgi:hypothetical protein
MTMKPTIADEHSAPESTSLHNLKLNGLCFFFDGYKSIGPSLKTDIGRQVSADIDGGAQRLQALGKMPMTMAFMSSVWHQAWSEAAKTWRSRIKEEFREVQDRAAIQFFVRRLAIQIFDQKLTGPQHHDFEASSLPPAFLYDNAVENTDLFMSHSPDGHAQGLQFLFSLSVQAWTIFEVAAKKLWVLALNSDPKRLGRAGIQTPVSPGAEPEGSVIQPQKKPAVNIPIDILVDCDFNLSGKLGTYSEPKFNFQKLDKIREAYEAVWPKIWHSEFATVFDMSLKESAAVRNVIVHKGGIIDAAFAQQVTSNSKLHKLPIEKPIPMDADLAHRVASTSVTKAQALVGIVDRCLAGNSPTPPEVTAPP